MGREEMVLLAKCHSEILSFQSQYLKDVKDFLSHNQEKDLKRKRFPCDPFEQILLLILDFENKLTGANELNIFLVLMNRAERIEHQLLCIHILRKNTPRSSQEKLVRSGIFGILSKWIQFYLVQDVDSDDLSGIPVLTLLCHLLRECYYLDIDIAKKFDILRLIKRIAKLSSNINSVEELQRAVQDLKSCWQDEVNKQDSVVRAALLRSRKSSLLEKSKSENPHKIESMPSLDSNISVQGTNISSVEKKFDPPAKSLNVIEPQNEIQPSPVSPERKSLVHLRSNIATIPCPKSLNQSQGSQILRPLSGTISLRLTPTHQQDNPSEILQQAMLPKVALIKSSEVKGILKKSTPLEIGAEPKSTRRLITWNERLFDIRYFEVDSTNSMNKSTARLRQEVHQKKIMTTLCEWRRPDKRLFFSDDQTDVHSFEESIQRKRLLSILQKFYPDDDDIPSDPEDDPEVNEEPLRRVSGECTRIPWDHEDHPIQNSLTLEDENTQTFSQEIFFPETNDTFSLQARGKNLELSLHTSVHSTLPPDSYTVDKRDVCHFYNQRGGCRRGRDCQFIHGPIEKKRVVESLETGASIKRSRLDRSPSPPSRYGRIVSKNIEIDSMSLRHRREQMNLISTIYASNQSPPSPPPLKNPSALSKVSSTICSAYIGGGCRYGYKCHYLHDQIEMFGDLEDEDEVLPTPSISPHTWTKSIDRDGSVLVRMRGLPFDCTYSDILQFFTVFDVRREAIKIAMKDHKRTGDAFVKFRSTAHAIDAIRALNMKRMGKRYIELLQAEYYDADRISIL